MSGRKRYAVFLRPTDGPTQAYGIKFKKDDS